MRPRVQPTPQVGAAMGPGFVDRPASHLRLPRDLRQRKCGIIDTGSYGGAKHISRMSCGERRPGAGEQRTNTVKYYKGKKKPASCGGCQVRSKALDSGSSLVGVRGFESHPPHYGYRFEALTSAEFCGR
jgi:hypothetical protein